MCALTSSGVSDVKSTTSQHCDISAPHTILFHASATNTESETLNHTKNIGSTPWNIVDIHTHTENKHYVVHYHLCLLPDMLELLVNTPVSCRVVV